ncbi:MAG: preprotein translocase subunit Sec61beta [Desulfurococcaceae archaeon]
MSSKKSKKRRETPSITSAAGLIRFFEESELKVALKPQLIILVSLIFVALVIILSKLLPPSI